jgi:hypothetical protein
VCAVGNRDGTEKSPYMPFQISFLHAEGLSGVRIARVRAGFLTGAASLLAMPLGGLHP